MTNHENVRICVLLKLLNISLGEITASSLSLSLSSFIFDGGVRPRLKSGHEKVLLTGRTSVFYYSAARG